ncbi:LysR family transcriptional regulator [Parasphingopyxis algicola]|uniref:LysR family transcriptional regulator n=1 Tax=Parasphingopyxis algicola TaxID=2026624 RepID=UPI0015A3CC67|nr:LysR family transcriptional regulator [Parasphingopyxis algicola]QLC26396.1 LysR family transcriptional regulator [Parasphingopyxis algicola]
MNLNQLRYFVAVVKHGSFRRASEELNISQPALSNSIKNLENFLGAELLKRGPKGVVATPYGNAIEAFFSSAIYSVERATHEIDLMKKGSRGHVSIGAPSGLLGQLVPEIIAEVRKDHPEYTFSVSFAYLNELLNQLRDGHVDFLITTYWPEANLTKDLVIESFADIDLSIFCRPQHPLARKRTVDLEDLASSEWIIPDSPGTRSFIKDLFGESHLTTIKEPISSGYVPFIHAMMLKMDLIGIIPDYFVADFVRHGQLVPLNCETTTRDLRAGIIYFQDRLRTPAMFSFLKTAQRIGKAHFN